jgi:two-component system response regulator WspF
MKIAIANDVAMAAEALRRVIASTAEHQVLWIARTGLEAVRMCAENRPDLILMDLNMPELDGVEATRQIMEHSPCAILVVTGRPQDNVNQVFRALGAGALDVTATPVLQGHPDGDQELLAKIRTMDKLIRHSGGSQAMAPRSSAAAAGLPHAAEPRDARVTSLVARSPSCWPAGRRHPAVPSWWCSTSTKTSPTTSPAGWASMSTCQCGPSPTATICRPAPCWSPRATTT